MTDNGGPAFPTQPTTIYLGYKPTTQSEIQALAKDLAERQPLGMSLRTWLVGQALSGIHSGSPESRVNDAEAIADEHLRREEERQEKSQPPPPPSPPSERPFPENELIGENDDKPRRREGEK